MNFEVIPAIDIIDGKCVRLTQGDYTKKTIYNEDPLEVAKEFEAIGLKRIHLVDLDGAKAGRVKNWKVLERIANASELIIDFGGGIKEDEDMRKVFESGAAIATIGSMAVKQPDLFASWLNKYGNGRLLLGADVKQEKIVISGWMERTDISVFDFVNENKKKGVESFFCTDVSKDGLLEGPAVQLYKDILKSSPELMLIASGGVASAEDIKKIKQIGCSGVIIGKAIYEGRISMKELSKWCKDVN